MTTERSLAVLGLLLVSGCSSGASESARGAGSGGSAGGSAAPGGPGGGNAGTVALAGSGGTMAGVGGNRGGAGGSTLGSGGSAGGAAGTTSAGNGSGGNGGSGGSAPQALCADVTPYANCMVTDFASEDIFDNEKWEISTWGNDNRTHSADNLWVEDGALVMRVNGGTTPGAQTVGAEIVSTKTDFLYGSFRATAKTAAEPGTVSSPLFYYLSDTSEIDVEILGIENDEGLVNYTVHQNNQGENTYRLFEAGFDPSADFHEYRFDWTPEGVTYYLDGQPTGITLTGNTPYQAGRLMVNHWTLSDPGWGGGPPANDAFMVVKYLEFYYD
jgi:hypothetical protein